MSRDNDTHAESQVSTDAETVRSWTERHTLVPVRREHVDGPRLAVVSEEEMYTDDEELDWTQFERELRERGMIVVRSGDQPEDIDIVDQEEYDVDVAAGVAAAETGRETTVEMDGEDVADTGPATEESTAQESAAGETEIDEATATDEGVRVTPREEDEGKTVVNPDGKSVGMVVDVDNGQVYVNPDPSITDRIRTVLGWSDHSDRSYLLGIDYIDHIDDDQVVLRMEHGAE